MKTVARFVCTLMVLCLAASADAAVMFGATSAGGPGELYILNSANGAVIQDVGPLNNGATNYPITGLAFHPITGVLYGSTGNSQAGTQALLVTINTLTAAVTEVGSFNAGPISGGGSPATMADLAFDAAGNLYGVGSIGGPQLYSINPATGQATVIGSTGLTSTTGGGLGISPGNTFYGTPTSTRFGTYNSITGVYTNIANPVKPVGGAYAAMAFDGGTLYGLDLGPGPGLPTELVIFDQTTGAITDLGASVPALDAIAFTVPEPGSVSLLGLAAIGLLRRARR